LLALAGGLFEKLLVENWENSYFYPERRKMTWQQGDCKRVGSGDSRPGPHPSLPQFPHLQWGEEACSAGGREDKK
jgi:hypothetical protein